MKPSERFRQRSRHGSLALAGALAILALSSRARAERTAVDLTWEAPAGCPTAKDVQQRIRRLLGAAADQTARLHARGKIVRTGRKYRLTLTVPEAGTESERIIESSSCSELAGAAAVALGLLVRVELQSDEATRTNGAAEGTNAAQPGTGEPSGQAGAGQDKRVQGSGTEKDERPATATQPDATKAPPVAAHENAAAPTAAVDHGSERPHAIVQAPLLGFDVGPLTTPRPTLGVAIGGQWRGWHLTAGARLSLGETAWAEGPPAYGAKLDRLTGELRGCYLFGPQQFAAGPCVFAAVDRITARGVGTDVLPQTRHMALFAAGVGGLGRWGLGGPLAFVASVGIQIEASRPRLIVNELGTFEQLPLVAFGANLGVEWLL